MSKISSDGLQEITENIKNPSESIYNKFQKKGSLRWTDVKEEYDFIYKFLEGLDSWKTDNEPEDAKVIVNNKIYRPEQ